MFVGFVTNIRYGYYVSFFEKFCIQPSVLVLFSTLLKAKIISNIPKSTSWFLFTVVGRLVRNWISQNVWQGVIRSKPLSCIYFCPQSWSAIFICLEAHFFVFVNWLVFLVMLTLLYLCQLCKIWRTAFVKRVIYARILSNFGSKCTLCPNIHIFWA